MAANVNQVAITVFAVVSYGGLRDTRDGTGSGHLHLSKCDSVTRIEDPYCRCPRFASREAKVDCRCHDGRAHILFAAFFNLQRDSIFSMVSYGKVVEDGGYCVYDEVCISIWTRLSCIKYN